MRRVPYGSGWIVLAAAAVPFVVAAAKPVARAVGKGLKKLGAMIDDAAVEPEKVAQAPQASQATQPAQAAQATEAAQAATKPKAPRAATKKAAPKPTATASSETPKKVGPKPAPPKDMRTATSPKSGAQPMSGNANGGRKRPSSDVETG